jgi:hypothetical protein
VKTRYDVDKPCLSALVGLDDGYNDAWE